MLHTLTLTIHGLYVGPGRGHVLDVRRVYSDILFDHVVILQLVWMLSFTAGIKPFQFKELLVGGVLHHGDRHGAVLMIPEAGTILSALHGCLL